MCVCVCFCFNTCSNSEDVSNLKSSFPWLGSLSWKKSLIRPSAGMACSRHTLDNTHTHTRQHTQGNVSTCSHLLFPFCPRLFWSKITGCCYRSWKRSLLCLIVDTLIHYISSQVLSARSHKTTTLCPFQLSPLICCSHRAEGRCCFSWKNWTMNKYKQETHKLISFSSSKVGIILFSDTFLFLHISNHLWLSALITYWSHLHFTYQ